MSEKKKIAVLGGGPTALAAIYWLTSTPELRAKYEITLYQMGWRLGGKGASGRGKTGGLSSTDCMFYSGFIRTFSS